MSKNENIIAKLNELDRAVIEVKCAESDCRYMQIQECSSELGYDYTFYTEDGEDIDGGIYSCVSDSDQMGDIAAEILTEEFSDYIMRKILKDEEAEELEIY